MHQAQFTVVSPKDRQSYLREDRLWLATRDLRYAAINRPGPASPGFTTEEPESSQGASKSGRFSHDFGQIPIFPNNDSRIQAKLSIGQSNDFYEQEADRVADRIMRIPEPQMQRTCDCGGVCPTCQVKQQRSEHDRVGTKSADGGNASQGAAPAIVSEVLGSSGQPLDAQARAFMEPRFGHDFSRVRIHIGAPAAEAARAVNAVAFTMGDDVVFAAGQYDPGTRVGKSLLAHELTHVVQQDDRSSTAGEIQRADGDESEREKGVMDQPEVPFDWMVLPFPMGVPQVEPAEGELLPPEEIERRRKLVEASAKKAAASYPWAATLLLRWLARDPREQELNLGPDQLLREDSGFPTAVRTSVRELLRKGVEARLHEDHREHFKPGQKDLHLRGSGSFEFIRAGVDPKTLTPFQKDLSIALGGVSYTVDAQLSLRWTTGKLTRANVTAAKISIVDNYDFNLGDLAQVPLPAGMQMPASFLPDDMAALPLPAGITLQDLPIPEEVVTYNVNLGGQEWIAVKDDWMANIAFSGGAADFPIHIDPFDLPIELFTPFTISEQTVQ